MQGMLGYFAVAVESNANDFWSFNYTATSVAIAAYVPILSEGLQATRADIQAQGLRAQFDEEETYNGLISVGGNVAMEVHPLNIGYFLRSFFDATSTSVGSAGASAWYNLVASNANLRVHQFLAAQTTFQNGSGSDLPTLTFEIFRPQGASTGSAFAYYNCAANQFELTVQAGNLARCSFDFIGREFGRKARTTPTFETAQAFVWAQASVSVAGAGKAFFESLTIRGNNNLQAYPFLNGQYRNAMIKRTAFRTFEVNGSLTFSNDTDYDTFVSGSESQLQMTWTLPTSEVLQLTAPAFRYTTHPVNLAGPGRIAVSFNGRAMWHAGSGTAMQILLANGRTNPYTVSSNR